MDINSTALSTATVKPAPDAEPGTPTRIHLSKPLSLTNGVLKRHQPLPSPQPFHVQTVSYKECLKNHAASLGGHALDGCGEFMTSPGSIPTDPTSLKCAACGCHRNFHRRDPEDSPHPGLISAQHVIEYQPHHRHHPPPPLPHRGNGGARSGSQDSPSPPPISSSYYPSAPHMLLALSAGISGGGTAPHPENNPGPASNGRKRFRTKFTQEQKERMHEFAERVGWKMQKRDDDAITEFCSEVGVERGVLKVWMHNNKSTLGKNVSAINGGNGNNSITTTTAATTTTQYHIQINNNNDNENNLAHQFHDHRTVVATNGSSSSS